MGDLSRAPKRLAAADRRDALLRAAEREFAVRGYEGARLEDIADATGVTKAMVYRHFPSKEDLFLAVLRDACLALEKGLGDVVREEAPIQTLLSRAIRVWFDFVSHREDAFLLTASRAPGLEAAVQIVDETRDRIVKQIVDATGFRVSPTIPDADAPALVEGMVRAIVGAAEAIAAWWARERPYSDEVAWLSVTNLLWLGVERLLGGELWLPSMADSDS